MQYAFRPVSELYQTVGLQTATTDSGCIYNCGYVIFSLIVFVQWFLMGNAPLTKN